MELNNVSNSSLTSSVNTNSHPPRRGRCQLSLNDRQDIGAANDQEALQESFIWHVEEHIPFDIGDVNLDYELTGQISRDAARANGRGQSDKSAN